MSSKVVLVLFLSALVCLGWAGFEVQQVELGDNYVYFERQLTRNRTGARAWCNETGGELLKISAGIMYTLLMTNAEIPAAYYWIDGLQDRPSFTAEADCTNGTVNFDGIPSSSKDYFTTGCASLYKTGTAHTNKLQLADCNTPKIPLCTVPKSYACPVRTG